MPDTTVSFQQGSGGYNGTTDTDLRAVHPSTSLADQSGISVDSSDAGAPAQALLRFDGLFGNDAGQVPVGARILTATLTVQSISPGNGAELHRMLQPWSESDTWNSLGAGIQADGVEAAVAADLVTGTLLSLGTTSLNVTSSVQDWANGSDNLGWALLPVGSDGWDFLSSEAAIPPKLTITYESSSTAEPAPGSNTGGVADSDDNSVRFAVFGDYGNGAGTQDVANLIDRMGVDFIVTTGDNSYGTASPIDVQIGQFYSDYIGNYVGMYGAGSSDNRFWPTIGNHEYSDLGINAYLSYFTLPGNERYYDFTSGPAHFFVVNSDSREPDGTSAASRQAQWLKAGLEASDSAYNFVFFHHPSYVSGGTGPNEYMQWPFEDWGATAVFNGHAHLYERILRDDNGDGAVFPYFVSGLGGRSSYGFGSPVSGSQARYNGDDGTLIVSVDDNGVSYEFWSVSGGGSLIDKYSI